MSEWILVDCAEVPLNKVVLTRTPEGRRELMHYDGECWWDTEGLERKTPSYWASIPEIPEKEVTGGEIKNLIVEHLEGNDDPVKYGDLWHEVAMEAQRSAREIGTKFGSDFDGALEALLDADQVSQESQGFRILKPAPHEIRSAILDSIQDVRSAGPPSYKSVWHEILKKVPKAASDAIQFEWDLLVTNDAIGFSVGQGWFVKSDIKPSNNETIVDLLLKAVDEDHTSQGSITAVSAQGFDEKEVSDWWQYLTESRDVLYRVDGWHSRSSILRKTLLDALDPAIGGEEVISKAFSDLAARYMDFLRSEVEDQWQALVQGECEEVKSWQEARKEFKKRDHLTGIPEPWQSAARAINPDDVFVIHEGVSGTYRVSKYSGDAPASRVTKALEHVGPFCVGSSHPRLITGVALRSLILEVAHSVDGNFPRVGVFSPKR